MEAQSPTHNLCAALVADPRYSDLRLALYDALNQHASRDASEAFGAYRGLIRTFDQIQEWAEMGKASKLKEAQPQKPEEIDIPQFADPDMER